MIKFPRYSTASYSPTQSIKQNFLPFQLKISGIKRSAKGEASEDGYERSCLRWGEARDCESGGSDIGDWRQAWQQTDLQSRNPELFPSLREACAHCPHLLRGSPSQPHPTRLLLRPIRLLVFLITIIAMAPPPSRPYLHSDPDPIRVPHPSAPACSPVRRTVGVAFAWSSRLARDCQGFLSVSAFFVPQLFLEGPDRRG